MNNNKKDPIKFIFFPRKISKRDAIIRFYSNKKFKNLILDVSGSNKFNINQLKMTPPNQILIFAQSFSKLCLVLQKMGQSTKNISLYNPPDSFKLLLFTTISIYFHETPLCQVKVSQSQQAEMIT